MSAAPIKPKITFICEGLVTSIGGAERVLCEVASHLAEAGYDVDVVTHEKTPGVPFYPLSDKVRVVPLRPPPEGYGTVRRVLEPLRDALREVFHALRLNRLPGVARLAWIDRQGGFWRRLQRYLAQNHRDVAIAFMPRAMVALALAKTDYPLACIASTHTAPGRDFTEDDGVVSVPGLLRQSLPVFDRITVLQETFRHDYPPELRSRVVVVPNAIAPVKPNKAQRENLILAVGRHVPIKGHGVLIDAFAQIAPEFPDWTVEIYGQGPDTDALQCRIAALGLTGCVRLMPTTRDIQRQYRRAALLAHPSLIEGFSLVAGEALASSLPVVGFADCPGINALIENGVNGVLVPEGADRVDGLAKALASLMADPEKRAVMGQAGPASVTRYAPDKIMAQWERLIVQAYQDRSEH